MAFPAADLWFGDRPVSLHAKGSDQNTPLKKGVQRTGDRSFQLQEFTGIGLQYGRHRACLAKVGGPFLAGSLEQPALFHVTAAEVIAVKIFTFPASRSFHKGSNRTGPQRRYPVRVIKCNQDQTRVT